MEYYSLGKRKNYNKEHIKNFKAYKVVFYIYYQDNSSNIIERNFLSINNIAYNNPKYLETPEYKKYKNFNDVNKEGNHYLHVKRQYINKEKFDNSVITNTEEYNLQKMKLFNKSDVAVPKSYSIPSVYYF